MHVRTISVHQDDHHLRVLWYKYSHCVVLSLQQR